MRFVSSDDSHKHSLQTLDSLYEHDDFMLSIGTLVDLGCGSGLDLEWWATRTTRDDNPEPLNIECVGVDMLSSCPVARKYHNITYQKTNFEQTIIPPRDKKFDVLWSHDSFQYCLNPIATLANWHSVASTDAMLVLIVEQTTNLHLKNLDFTQQNGCYYNHTLVSLIHMLAVNGWDCASGFFKKNINDPWLHAIVYKSQHQPMDPMTTTWYELAEKNLLPESAVKSIQSHGYLKQQDLVLPWLDKSLTWYGQH